MAVWLYAIVPSWHRLSAASTGLYDEPLETVRCGRVTAVVGEMDRADLAGDLATRPDGAPMSPAQRRSLARHDRVVRHVAADADALLPARYGVHAASRAALRALVSSRASDFAAALRMVAGAEQMTLRVSLVTRAGRARAAKVRRRRPAPGGRAYLLARAHAQRAALLTEELAPIRAALDSLIRHERVIAGPPPFEATYYHLINRGRAAAYRRLVRRRMAEVPAIGVTVTGPYPPYAFVPRSLPW